MNKRKLGKTHLMVSEVGLGCWQLGGDFGPVADCQADEILNAAIENKINFFDTADVYGAGQSERYIGAAVPAANSELIVATKYGREAVTYPDKYSLTNMRDALKRAQDRLQRDTIDLIQLHCIPTQVMAYGEIFDWLRTVQQDGLVKYFGASVETVAEAQLCAQQDDLATLQIIFNLLRQRPVKELFDITKEREIGVIVRLPLASGLLSGKYSASTQFAATDHRNYNKDGAAFSVGETFSGIPFEKGLELTEQLAKFKPSDITMAQFAMRWILDHDAVSTVIAGASSPKQVAQNVSVANVAPLSEDIHADLYDFYLNAVEQHIRGVF